MKYTGPKVRLARQLNVPLTPKATRIMTKRDYPPGQHGPTKKFSRNRPTPYKEQLLEKQKLRAQYNIHEKQLRNYYAKANSKAGSTPDNLIAMLESRLDSVVLRAGLATTIYQARQIVNHGHIVVDGKRVNIPSYSVKVGQQIAVRQKSRKMLMFETALAQTGRRPEYISFSEGAMSAELRYLPKVEEVQVFADLPKVVEYYSR